VDSPKSSISKSHDWRARLSLSRDQGTGFAAPGGGFTRALFEWVLADPRGKLLRDILAGQRVVELGAGTMSYGYKLAATCGARNFVAVEPFYSDLQNRSILSCVSENDSFLPRIPFKVIDRDMLDYLKDEPDDLLCVLACGIENCILPGPDYRSKVECEIARVTARDTFFLSSHSDLFPKDLQVLELVYPRPSNPKILERLRIHGRSAAFDRHGGNVSRLKAECREDGYGVANPAPWTIDPIANIRSA
jgi:hypothetical protein